MNWIIIVILLGGSHIFPVRPLEWGVWWSFHQLQSADPRGQRLLFASRLHRRYFPFKRQKSQPLSQLLPAEALRPPGCPGAPRPILPAILWTL